jgi:hypothetical protein
MNVHKRLDHPNLESKLVQLYLNESNNHQPGSEMSPHRRQRK